MKDPSPEMKPAIQFGFGIFAFKPIGLSAGIIEGDANWSCSGKPLLITPFFVLIFKLDQL